MLTDGGRRGSGDRYWLGLFAHSGRSLKSCGGARRYAGIRRSIPFRSACIVALISSSSLPAMGQTVVPEAFDAPMIVALADVTWRLPPTSTAGSGLRRPGTG